MSNIRKPKVKRLRILRTLFLDLLLDRHARPIFIYVAFFILFTAALYHWLEGWGWIDSFYFVVITLTTIGYGDLTPTTSLTKLITIFYSLNGIIVLLILFDIIRRFRRWEIPDKENEQHKT